MKLLSSLMRFVMFITKKHSIDESHGLGHSMDVLVAANRIYSQEVLRHEYLREQERIIYVSAVLHDMCDKKYMNQSQGISEIESFLCDKLLPEEIEVSQQIMSTMSYSKVKESGFPNLGDYQLAYHIVREADLLCAINFDRCMIYNMYKGDQEDNMQQTFDNAVDLFDKRIFRHEEDGLYMCDFSKKQDIILKKIAMNRIHTWRRLLRP